MSPSGHGQAEYLLIPTATIELHVITVINQSEAVGKRSMLMCKRGETSENVACPLSLQEGPMQQAVHGALWWRGWEVPCLRSLQKPEIM